jgi:hypothetical protein
VPRGYATDHPAAEYLRYRNFLAGREFPPQFATEPAFYPTLIATYKAIMPLVRFLNEPLAADVGLQHRVGPTFRSDVPESTLSVIRTRPA